MILASHPGLDEDIPVVDPERSVEYGHGKAHKGLGLGKPAFIEFLREEEQRRLIAGVLQIPLDGVSTRGSQAQRFL